MFEDTHFGTLSCSLTSITVPQPYPRMHNQMDKRILTYHKFAHCATFHSATDPVDRQTSGERTEFAVTASSNCDIPGTMHRTDVSVDSHYTHTHTHTHTQLTYILNCIATYCIPFSQSFGSTCAPISRPYPHASILTSAAIQSGGLVIMGPR